MSRFLLGAGALACALLSACASAPMLPPSGATVAPYRDTLNLSGRLNVNYSKDGKPETITVNFDWRQRPARTDVSLYTPLGSTIAAVSVTPHAATLTQGGKPPRSAPDLDTLSTQLLGWSLPVSGMRDWLQGYASAADGSRFVASPANDSVLTRDGWHLHYVSWQEPPQDGAAAPQPKRIDASRVGGGQVNQMAIRVVLDAPAAP